MSADRFVESLEMILSGETYVSIPHDENVPTYDHASYLQGRRDGLEYALIIHKREAARK